MHKSPKALAQARLSIETLLSLLLFLALAIVPYQSIFARSGITFTPYGGYYHFGNDDSNNDLVINGVSVNSQDIDDTSLVGLGIGYQFNDYWSAEAAFFKLKDTEIEDTNLDVDSHMFALTGYYNFVPHLAWSPYTSFGFNNLDIDIEQIDDDHETMFHAGLGMNFRLSDNWNLRAEARGLYSFDENDLDFALLGGIRYLFARQEAVTPAVASQGPKDSDSDGIYDDQDECPNTPAGVPVDDRGCPLDSDNDGVPDYQDKCPNTPAKAIVDEDGCPIILEKPVKIRLKIHFDLDKATVKPKYYDEIARAADFMVKYPLTNVVVEGHTDHYGTDEYNLNLSQRRANAVREILIQRYRIAPNRLSAKGFGESQPIATNDTSEGRAANRRVVAVFTATERKMKEKP